MIKLIIVNFNQRSHLDSLIESIQDQNDWEALVVDNSGELVGQSFLNTKIINPKKIQKIMSKKNDFGQVWKYLIKKKYLYVSNIIPSKWFTIDNPKQLIFFKKNYFRNV